MLYFVFQNSLQYECFSHVVVADSELLYLGDTEKYFYIEGEVFKAAATTLWWDDGIVRRDYWLTLYFCHIDFM